MTMTQKDERAFRNTFYARLRPIVVELLSMMYGHPYTPTNHEHLVSRYVSNVHPETLLRSTHHASHLKIVDDTTNWLTDDRHMDECVRRASISRAWFEKLLGEPVGQDENIWTIADRWNALGRPRLGPCIWNAT
jgi:hypothetical protein